MCGSFNDSVDFYDSNQMLAIRWCRIKQQMKSRISVALLFSTHYAINMPRLSLLRLNAIIREEKTISSNLNFLKYTLFNPTFLRTQNTIGQEGGALLSSFMVEVKWCLRSFRVICISNFYLRSSFQPRCTYRHGKGVTWNRSLCFQENGSTKKVLCRPQKASYYYH